MPDPIFERYKEQLRAGHVAVMRGQLHRALEHYRQASELAEARPLPHTSMGQVLLRMGRTDEALAAFSRALGRAPQDEAALTGRAEALAAAHREPEAAEILERLAEVQASSNREPEALATLERALTLGVTKRRQRRADELAARLGITRPTPGTAEASPPEASPAEASPAGDLASIIAPPDLAAVISGTLESDHVLHIQAARAPVPSGPADLLASSDPESFLDDAEQARDAGQMREALALYVLASDAYARAGALDAALDACQRAMEISVDAPSVHLALARLYLARGWRERAIEKLTLLDRLLSFSVAGGARRQIAALAASQAAGDPRLLALATPAPAPPPSGEVAPASV